MSMEHTGGSGGRPQRLPGLREQRRHGTDAFPCSFYIADESREAPGTPFVCRMHWQDEIEILHFERGVFEASVNTEHFTIDRECFCFVGSGRLHAFSSPSGYLEQALLFAPSLLAAEDSSAAHEQLLGPLGDGLLHFPLLVTKGDPAFAPIREEYRKIMQVFERAGARIRDQYNAPDPISQLRVRAGILNILAVLAEHGLLRTSPSREDPRIGDLKKVITYVRNGYADKIYIRDLAGIMNLNEQYFCRYFKKTMGRTPVAYINETRIRQARRMLSGTSESITQICSACGFGNMSHFIEEFRKATGYTPSQYRRRQPSSPAGSGPAAEENATEELQA